MVYLRQPIISVLGHVDHGKTSVLDYIRNSKLISKEAGGITQHIGATEVPKKDIVKIIKDFIPEKNIKIPGLLFIDTPGHKAFTSLRKRGGSISDIGILVIDINEGFKPQTIEAIEILKASKTPFVIAANKLDNISGWISNSKIKLADSFTKQREEVIYRLEEKVYEIVGKISEFNFDCDRFDRVEDFTKKIALIPISAKTGEGMKELISTLVGLTQKYMEKKLTIKNENISRGVILEVKDYTGLGKTYDVIVYDGVMKIGDIVLALDIDNVQTSKLKSILKPSEMKEIRDSSTKFKTMKEIQAASGIKLACPEFKDIKAGMPIITLRAGVKTEELNYYIRELEKEKAEINSLSSSQGVLVKADTLGSLEALANILSEHNIPIRKAKIGKVNKMDIIDASADLKKNPKNAIILNFSQKLDDEIISMAKEYKVALISNEIIYKLIEDSINWLEEKNKEIERKRLDSLIMPFKIKILKNCIFRISNPAIIGVETIAGILKINSPMMTNYGKKVGSAKSIKDKNEYLKELKTQEQAAISMEDLIIGRHAQEDDFLYSFMGEENFRSLKKNSDLLSKEEIQILKEIAEIMRKEDTLWGL